MASSSMAAHATLDWQNLFAATEGQSLDFFPPVILAGSIAVKPPSEVFEEGILEWRYSLVGQFIGGSPNFSALQKLVNLMWGKVAPVEVRMAGSNLYIFSFANSTALYWVLERGPWHIQNRPLLLRKWEPNLAKLEFDLACMPIWIHLHNVPLKLYSMRGLSYITSALGSPLYMDTITATRQRLEFARVCVEVPAGYVFPDSIDVVLQDGSIALVYVTVPWIPPSCSHCKETLQATVVGKAPVSDVDVVKSDTLEVSDLCETVQQVFVAEKIPKNCEGVVLPATLVGADSSTDSDTVVEDVDSSTVDVSLGKAVRPFVAYVAVDDCNFPPLAGGRKVRGKKQNSKSEGVEIPGRQPRAAATGVANLLQEMKGRKRDDPDKVKDSSLSVGNVPFVSSQ
ncbi:hypothetical protein V6N13_137991 [Hibiscus sabdariffa]